MDKKVNIRITANDRQAQSTFKRVEKGFTGLQRQVKGLQGMLGFFGGGLGADAGFEGLRRFLTASIDAARAAEVSQRRLEAVLKATGHAAGLTAGNIEDLAQKYARLTVLSDEQVRDAAGTLLTFRNVSGQVFEEALALSIDLSQTMGQDLKSSIVQVGKALNDPVAGISALSRVGITFSAQQKEQIKNFVEMGRQAEAMQVILEELRGEFGGTAEAMNTGLNKATSDLSKEWGNLLEAFGRSEGMTTVVETVLGGLAEKMRELTEAIENSQTPLELYLRTVAKLDPGLIGMAARAGLGDLLYSRQEQHGASGSWGPAEGTGTGGTTDPPPVDQKALDKIQAVIDRLRFEQQQLDRTATEQKVYNELKRAGVSLNSQAGQTIAGLVRGLEAEKTAQKAAAEAAREHAAALEKQRTDSQLLAERGAELYQATRSPFEQVKEQIAELEFLRGEWIDEATYQRAYKKLLQDYIDTTDEIKVETEELSEVWLEAFRSMQNVASDFFFDVLEGNFSDLGDSFRDMVNRMLADWASVKAMEGLFGSSFASSGELGGLLGAGLGILGGAFSGGSTAVTGANPSAGGTFAIDPFPKRAGGGAVFPGQSYLVGERRPEIFTPQMPGTILPNAAGASISVPVTVTNGNPALAAELQSRIESTVVDVLRRHS